MVLLYCLLPLQTALSADRGFQKFVKVISSVIKSSFFQLRFTAKDLEKVMQKIYIYIYYYVRIWVLTSYIQNVHFITAALPVNKQKKEISLLGLQFKTVSFLVLLKLFEEVLLQFGIAWFVYIYCINKTDLTWAKSSITSIKCLTSQPRREVLNILTKEYVCTN